MKDALMSLREAIRHAFAIPNESTGPAEAEAITALSRFARERHLSFPLLVVAEALRPLATLASSTLAAAEPLVTLFLPAGGYRRITEFVGNRRCLEALAAALEDGAPRANP